MSLELTEQELDELRGSFASVEIDESRTTPQKGEGYAQRKLSTGRTAKCICIYETDDAIVYSVEEAPVTEPVQKLKDFLELNPDVKGLLGLP